jgi:hypothetical protein
LFRHTVGATHYDGEGRAYLFLGSAGGLGSQPAWEASDGQLYAQFGFSVNNAGDVNGDGYGDIVVTAANHDSPEDGEGKAYLWRGGPAGVIGRGSRRGPDSGLCRIGVRASIGAVSRG